MFEAVEISREITGSGQNLLLCGDVYQQQPALSALAGGGRGGVIFSPLLNGGGVSPRPPPRPGRPGKGGPPACESRAN